MMEVMIVIAILVVMAALIFVSVMPFLKSLYQKEMDETAQEIYVAAQNHLTIAESMGFLEGKENGTPIKDEEGKDEEGKYFFVIGDDYSDLAASNKVLAYMLPYGSIDEKVRTGGSYVISYDYKTASVIDVFYADPKGRFGDNVYFGKNVITQENYPGFLSTFGGTGAEKNENRQQYSQGGTIGGSAIIGWYNGEAMGVDAGEPFKVDLKVKNGDRLMVEATVSNAPTDRGLEVGIIITGRTSGNHTPLLKLESSGLGLDDAVYTGCLDDVASSRTDTDLNNILKPNNGHFAERFADYGLIPGEDVTISAFAYYTDVVGPGAGTLYPVAMSKKVTTNSLFASVGKEKDSDDDATMHSVARIAYTRHLENLSKAISGYDSVFLNKVANGEAEPPDTDLPAMTTASELASASGSNSTTNQPGSSTVDADKTHARQIKDIDFTDFMDAILDGGGETDGKVKIHAFDRTIGDSQGNTFMPVSIDDYALDYNGSNHKISNVVVKTEGDADAGLFGELEAGSSLENMQLMSFNILSKNGNAGALAGTLQDATVKNVLVFNEAYQGENPSREGFGPVFGKDETTDAKLEISGKGNVGGLVGSSEDCTIEKSAASVYVNSSGANAGGLIGEAKSGTTITGCYAGGHTSSGEYNMETTTGEGRVNVIAATNAGGLVGSSAAEIKASYATNSVSGATAGGLIGSVVSGGNVSYSYAAGKVAGTTIGAFIGSNGVTLGAGNQYTPTVNGSMPTIGSSPTDTTSVADMFPTLASYQKFANPDNQHEAKPYDSALVAAYTIGNECLYPMPTITDLLKQADLESILEDSDLDLVKKHYGDWPKLETEVVNQ